MQKIMTVLKRDEANRAFVVPEVVPAYQWVLDGEGIPTRKFDGTCVMYDPKTDEWWARREVKPGKLPPEAFREVEHDPITNKRVGWEPISNSGFFKYFCEALARMDDDKVVEGTYELVGPKIQGNPEEFSHHALIPHAYAGILWAGATPSTPVELMKAVKELPFEGVVWHHPDGRMAKLKRRDIL